jgi:uncharacterized protein with ParB-like and HNH nuclease domain/integrase
MESTLSAQETPIHKVFSDDYLFTIPPVQRPYSWTTDEAGELLKDLIDFIEHSEINEKNISKVNEPYFLGSIVLVKNDSPDSEVLDGQQRLTTITILLAVLRDYLSEVYANDIEKRIVQKGDMVLNTSDTYRLRLRKKDEDFFKTYIQERGGTHKLNKKTDVKTDSQRHIRDNAIHFINCLNELDEQTLNILPRVIGTRCFVVVVSTPNFDSAFRIFTVLNDRGLDLMPSDIFKARVIEAISEKEQEDYTMKWEDIELSLGRERFNKLFDHIRMIIQKRKGSENSKAEYDRIFSTTNGKKFIDEYLIPYSEIFLKLVEFRSFYTNQPQMIKVLSLLNRIDNNDWIPLAMYYMRGSGDEHIEEFLYRIEKFAGISMILRKNFNWRMSKYSQILREFESGVDLFSTDSTLEVPEEEKVSVLEKLEGDVYLDLKDTAKKYILLRLDSLLTVGQPFYDYSIITVEHVLPQIPQQESDWFIIFPNPDQYVHKLGNLVLLTRAKNSQARNYDFQKKKSSYFQMKNGVTTYALTTQVIQENEWTPEVLEKRQKNLIDLLKKAWDLREKKVTKQEPLVDLLEENDNQIKNKLFNDTLKEQYLSTFENEQSRKTIRYIFYKTYSAEDLLEKDLYNFNSTEISKMLKNMNTLNLSVARSNGRFITKYISWAIDQGYRLDKLNPMKGIDDSYYDDLVDKSKKVHHSFSEFLELLDGLENSQDQALLFLMWEGVIGEQFSQINKLKYSDVDFKNNTIYVIERDCHVAVDVKCIKFLEKTKSDKFYYQYNSNTREFTKKELLDSPFVFRNVKSPRGKANQPVNINVFYNRINTIKDLLDKEYLTPNSLKQSGMIKMAVDLYLEESKLGKEQFAKIGDKYQAPMISNGGYDYYNTYLMKEHINTEKIKELYGIEVQI